MESAIHQIVIFPAVLLYMINKLPLKIQVTYLSAFIAMLAMIYFGIISPLIFNYFIIPNIEKKLRRKLEYDPFLYNSIFLSKWMLPQAEISCYITKIYIDFKLKSKVGVPKKFGRSCLKRMGYTIDMASKLEITMSIISVLSVVLMFISSALMLIVGKKIA